MFGHSASPTAALGTGAIKVLEFTGRNGTGNITVTGLAVGDVILHCQNKTDGTNATASYTAKVATADTLVQSSASDLSAKTMLLTVRSA